MSRVDPSKAKEAQDEVKLGEKALSTGLMKWKPDYLSAEPHFSAAARLFKQAGLMDSAVESWRRAAQCAYKMGNLKQAAVTLENAAREASLSKDSGGKSVASDLYVEAASHLHEADEVVRAADLKMKAAKLLEGFNNDKAARLIDESCAMFDGLTDKDVYALDAMRKALQFQLSLGKHASAMRTMDRLLPLYIRQNQNHNIHKMVLSRVVLLLGAGDGVAAQREYEKSLDYPGFAATDDAAAAEDLLSAYHEFNAEEVKTVANRNVFNYLDHHVTKVARALSNSLLSGNAVHAASAEESAAKAVKAAPAASELGGFRELGGTAVSIGGGGAGGRTPGAPVDEDEEEATRKARKAQEKEAAARASLFARPGAGAGAGEEEEGGVPGYGGAEIVSSGGAGGGYPTDFHDAGAEYDYEAAFKELHGGGGDDGFETGAAGGAGAGAGGAEAEGNRGSAALADFGGAAAASAEELEAKYKFAGADLPDLT